MATAEKIDSKTDIKAIRLNPGAQTRLSQFASSILEKHRSFDDIRRKMDMIDSAYSRYQEQKAAAEAGESSGIDVGVAQTPCNVFADDDVIPPIVVSQVDSFTAYLADVFLSGTPLFPVISNPQKRMDAEKLEAILDDHANIGGYVRQLLMFLRDGCKYNLSGIEVDWDAMSEFSVLNDVARDTGQSMTKKFKKFNRLKRLNPRNLVWDWSVAPGDVSEIGDYAGYIERISRTKLKQLLNKWSIEQKALNVEKAMLSGAGSSNSTYGSPNYKEDPVLSNYEVRGQTGRSAAPNWDAWFDAKSGNKSKRMPVLDAQYEIFKLYARIMPSEFGIVAPQPNTPQIWKLVFVNSGILVYAERVISAFDRLPILFGQPVEDGLGYQTQSIAEGAEPFQRAAGTLFNIRFAAARRAVSDRALYLPDMIAPSDINAAVPAPKIPVKISQLSTKGIKDAYEQIPFRMDGLETVMQDASLIMNFAKDLHGVNGPRQGNFQKGNKSVQEWVDTMGGSDGRMRLPAITLECQVFAPLKSMLVLNILQFGEDGHVVSQVTGNSIEYKINELRAAKLSFKVADGYTPKSKLGSAEVIMAGMNLIMNSPQLQAQFAQMLPSMFLHFMSLSGLKGMEMYDPSYSGNPPAQPVTLDQNNLAANPAAQQPAPLPAQQPVV
jgi:hypothetical protein